MDPARFREVVIPSAGALATTQFAPAATNESDNRLDGEGLLVEPLHVQDGPDASPPEIQVPDPAPVVVSVPKWRASGASFYGPGFYGKGLACRGILTKELLGVAHRTLPCGTLITFKNPANGRILTVPVVDRGPYVSGRLWDLTGGACVALDFCYTGRILWMYGSLAAPG